ncbi:MAG: ABC transporter permease subunit [candidate division Zixibacteria bacterium]|nr:ABC transporter permease subunit [candidate division Zixibacteria bacterium]
MNKRKIDNIIEDLGQIEFDERASAKFKFKDIFSKVIFKNPSMAIGSIMIFLLIILAIIGPSIAPYDSQELNMSERFESPSWNHIFGTDNMGRDIFSRVLHGTRVTFKIGLASVGIGLAFGLLIGLFAGYSRGKLQNVLMRFIDILYSFPALLIAMALVAFLGPSTRNLIIAVGIASIRYYARVTYGVVLVERNKPYLDAAEIVGAGALRQMFRHLIPNIVPPLIVVATLGFAGAVLNAAGLSFLGLGVQPPTPEWGLILSSGRNYIIRAPWLLIFPGLAIMVAVLSFNIFGDGLRDLLDPKQQRKV